MNRSGGPVDRATLEDLAASSRILADQGVFDAAGHVSLRHPGHPDRFLMSRSLAPQMITADDIMEFDLDCNLVQTFSQQNPISVKQKLGEQFHRRVSTKPIFLPIWDRECAAVKSHYSFCVE